MPPAHGPAGGPGSGPTAPAGWVQIVVGVSVNAAVRPAAARMSGFPAAGPRVTTARRFASGGLPGVFAPRTALFRMPAPA